MTHEKMPEALRLADALNEIGRIKDMGRPEIFDSERQAAAELRRQHAEIERLRAEVGALRKVRMQLSDDKVIAAAMFYSNGHFVRNSGRFIFDFARAIEEAHGITTLQSTKEHL